MRIFRISQRIYKLQLLPIYQEKESARGRSSSSGQLGGRAASAAPFGPVVVAGLAARGSAPRPLALARSVALPAPGFAVWVGLWRAASLLAAGVSVVRLARAVRGAGCATACPWVSGCGALWVGAGFGASCAAASCPGGLRGLCRPGRFPAGPVLVLGARSSRPAVGAACPPSWPSASGIASLPPVRACGLWPLGGGPASAPVGAWVLALAAASLQLSRLSVAVAWVLVWAGCGLVAGVHPPPRPPVRPPTGGSQSSWRSGFCTNCSTNRTYICTTDSTLSTPLPPGG